VHNCKSYCEKNQWHLFCADMVYKRLRARWVTKSCKDSRIKTYRQLKGRPNKLHLLLWSTKCSLFLEQPNLTSGDLCLLRGVYSDTTQLNSTAWTTVDSVCRSWRHKQKHDWLGCTLFNWVSWFQLSCVAINTPLAHIRTALSMGARGQEEQATCPPVKRKG